jgi:hypothetical protein
LADLVTHLTQTRVFPICVPHVIQSVIAAAEVHADCILAYYEVEESLAALTEDIAVLTLMSNKYPYIEATFGAFITQLKRFVQQTKAYMFKPIVDLPSHSIAGDNEILQHLVEKLVNEISENLHKKYYPPQDFD